MFKEGPTAQSYNSKSRQQCWEPISELYGGEISNIKERLLDLSRQIYSTSAVREETHSQRIELQNMLQSWRKKYTWNIWLREEIMMLFLTETRPSLNVITDPHPCWTANPRVKYVMQFCDLSNKHQHPCMRFASGSWLNLVSHLGWLDFSHWQILLIQCIRLSLSEVTEKTVRKHQQRLTAVICAKTLTFTIIENTYLMFIGHNRHFCVWINFCYMVTHNALVLLEMSAVIPFDVSPLLPQLNWQCW